MIRPLMYVVRLMIKGFLVLCVVCIGKTYIPKKTEGKTTTTITSIIFENRLYGGILAIAIKCLYSTGSTKLANTFTI